MTTLVNYVKALKIEVKKDNIPLLAAAQAYYYLLSIVPLLIVCFTIIPYLNIDPQNIISLLEDLLPSGIATIFSENIVNIIETPRGGLLTFGIIGSLWATSNGINAFIKAVNEAYEVDESRSFIKVRLLAIVLTLGMIASIIISILLPIFGNVIIDFFDSWIGISSSMVILLQFARWVFSILIIGFILLALYHFAPNKKIPFKHIIPGALTASTLWILISLGFSFYVSNFGNYSATYGSMGGIIILMIWFFLTGLILTIGAEINVIHHRNQLRKAQAPCSAPTSLSKNS
ncbi:YihY/virulence factor BrkB family protein [Virgibacillus sp. W0181]|uniref:YihY/virulence factor BrkB family protein n=1 Tax=Virgibacillus sp. W0181 TaxID=3391581 RepID=UPI003F448393